MNTWAELCDWTKAPYWANWWAVNPNGRAYWFAERPWVLVAHSLPGWDTRAASYETGQVFDATPDWQESLVGRI